MSPSAVLRNYCRVEEALVVCSALQDAGFDAAVDNLNHATLEWYLVPALGGIQVRIPASQLKPAKAYLNEIFHTAEQRLLEATGETADPIHRRRYWRAWIGIAIWFGVADLLGIATLWLALKLVPPDWWPKPDEMGVPKYELGTTIAQPPDLSNILTGLLFLLMLVLITWNEMYVTQRSAKARQPESTDPS